MDKQKIVWIILGALFFAPIALYAFQFEVGLWGKHSQWAEMGTFFAGIYSPIIAFMTLVILRSQNRHQHDMAYITINKQDLEFSLNKLEQYLDEYVDDQNKVKDILVRAVKGLDSQSLLDPSVKERLILISGTNSKAISLWVSIPPLLKGLSKVDRSPYREAYIGSQLKVTSVLTNGVCEALDKIYYSTSDGELADQLFYWKPE